MLRRFCGFLGTTVGQRHKPLSAHAVGQERGLFAWGNADSAQLGLELRREDEELDTFGASVRSPRRVSVLQDVAQVSPGAAHTIVIAADGSVWSCGYGGDGQTGIGDSRRDASRSGTGLRRLEGVKGVKAAAGGRHSLVVGEDGSLYSWGSNSRGQLGRDGGGTLEVSGSNIADVSLVRVLSDEGERIVDCAAGADFSIALTESGKVLTWGSGDNGRTGHGRGVNGGWLSGLLPGRRRVDEARPRVVRALDGQRASGVFAGVHSAAVLLENGRFVVFGAGRGMAIGTGRDCDAWEPEPAMDGVHSRGLSVALGLAHSLWLFEGGRVYGCGDGGSGELGADVGVGEAVVDQVEVHVGGGRPVEDIAAGWGCSAAVVDGGVYAWGSGAAGVLGRGEEMAETSVPVKVALGGPVDRVCIPSAGRSVFAWRSVS